MSSDGLNTCMHDMIDAQPSPCLQERLEEPREGDIGDAHIEWALRIGARHACGRMFQPQAICRLQAARRRGYRAAVHAIEVPTCIASTTLSMR